MADKLPSGSFGGESALSCPECFKTLTWRTGKINIEGVDYCPDCALKSATPCFVCRKDISNKKAICMDGEWFHTGDCYYKYMTKIRTAKIKDSDSPPDVKKGIARAAGGLFNILSDL